MSTVLITGASAGLGALTTRTLAMHGHRVMLLVRDVGTGERVAADVRASSPAADLDVRQCDLASLDSVRDFVDQLRAEAEPIDVVICNAGVQIIQGIARSADGYELCFAVNHLAHFLLVTALLDQLRRPARILTIGSEVHQGPLRSMGFPAPRWEEPRLLADPDRPGLAATGRAGRVRYANSKLANILFAYELARRAGSENLTANAFDPGLMPHTALDRQYPAALRTAYHAAGPVITRLPGIRDVADSAADLAWLATSPDAAWMSGRYVSVRTPRRSSRLSYDRDLGQQLWHQSAELTSR